MKTIRRIAEGVIVFCLIGILLLSVYNIYEKNKAYKDAEKVYKEIPSKNFAELMKANPDTVGWLEYEPLEIDYPVVQADDNSKYLTTLFDGSYGESGCLFVDCICEQPFEQYNTIIYGHHMFNGTMFGKFGKLKDKSFAEKHPKFTLYVPGNTYDLDIYAFLNPDSASDVYATNLSDDERAEYMAIINKEAVYTIGELKESDRLVLLSTCAYEFKDARYIVVCKMKKYKEEQS